MRLFLFVFFLVGCNPSTEHSTIEDENFFENSSSSNIDQKHSEELLSGKSSGIAEVLSDTDMVVPVISSMGILGKSECEAPTSPNIDIVNAYKLESSFGSDVGTVFSECVGCPEMVVLPKGHFFKVDSKYNGKREKNPAKFRKVRIPSKFAVSKFEITGDQWLQCVDAGACSKTDVENEAWYKDKRPAVKLNWYDAHQYVRWLSEVTRAPYRLLTSAEWEYAARAGTNTAFYTGDTISTSKAHFGKNYNSEGGLQDFAHARTLQVGSFAANDFGLHDMHGNVSEWTSDWSKIYFNNSKEHECSYVVVRGGSWASHEEHIMSSHESAVSPDVRNFYRGLRIARDIDS